MTLAADMLTDLATFLETDDFAVPALYTHEGSDSSITVIFSTPPRVEAFGGAEIEGSGFEVICKTSDVDGVAHRDMIRFPADGYNTEWNSLEEWESSVYWESAVNYYVIGIQPSDDGLLTTLILSKD